ncbi:helix-turn-helix domain-containing protein [Streptomyces sp. NPDC091292]|uniref:AraC-like ligand-binding domain-containing protein n=1 Tax=Streptomyces sp. NPDC091292 TaxID=3365991 RepID=UPI00380E3C08
MLIETVFRSEDVPAADRFESWRERMARTHAPMDLSSEYAADFRAFQRFISLGEVTVWPASFQPLVFRRTPKLIRQSDPEVYHLSLLLNGAAGATWGEQRVATYNPFDFHVNDSSRPYDIWTGPEPIRSVGVEVPKALLPLPRDRADRIIGHRLSGREGIGVLLAQFLVQVTEHTDQYAVSDGPRLGTVLLDLVAALFAHTLDAEDSVPPETYRRNLALEIRAFIQAHLQDPQLTPRAISQAHGISLSYLHRIFQDTDESVSAYLRRTRLARARDDLADPALRGIPVHAIAARWGFTHPAAFSRAFRDAYGIPPTVHRRRAIGPLE